MGKKATDRFLMRELWELIKSFVSRQNIVIGLRYILYGRKSTRPPSPPLPAEERLVTPRADPPEQLAAEAPLSLRILRAFGALCAGTRRACLGCRGVCPSACRVSRCGAGPTGRRRAPGEREMISERGRGGAPGRQQSVREPSVSLYRSALSRSALSPSPLSLGALTPAPWCPPHAAPRR